MSLVARVAAAGIAASLVLLAAACGSSQRSGVAQLGSNTTQVSGAVAFSSCMRSHGVPDYPDPGSNGQIPKESLEQLGVSEPRFEAAMSGCRQYLPNSGGGPTPAELQQARAGALSYARCMRAHGVADFPDPDSTGRIPDPATVGINQGAPRFETANQACGRHRPPYMPSNAAYNAWARTQPS